SKLSHIASEFCVNTLYVNLQVFDFSSLRPNPDDKEQLQKNWKKAVLDLFGRTRNALMNLATDNNIPPTDLYCTLLLVIKTEWGFLSANIGDGRSGVSNGKPHALSVPLQTFTVGATFFLIKKGWENIFRSYVKAVDDWTKIKYFFATTDGCQDFVMDQSDKGPRQGIYDNVLGDEARYDYNLPYEAFFDGLLASLNEVGNEPERNERLKRLIESGIYVLKGEEKVLKSISDPLLDDDKTLIIFHN
ncbi:MAG: protein phosphatase 2C domain-containing protein, partial [Bacteroidetes bacterium]|nr:protein phosphatase 2C domain-containing protein [Bacteroidota bacterium]